MLVLEYFIQRGGLFVQTRYEASLIAIQLL